MNRKKTALLILSVLMCCCLVGGIFAATAAAPKTYYDEAGNVLDWAFDQNGVSPVIPYADQNKTPVSQYYGIYSRDKATASGKTAPFSCLRRLNTRFWAESWT